MSSGFLRIIDEAPSRSLLLIAAGLVIVCQLVAMVMVAGGQVEKAQARDATQASAIAATMGCAESSRGASIKECGLPDTSPVAQSGADQASGNAQGVSLVTFVSPY